MSFVASRLQKTYVQNLDAPPGMIFPLLCPEREKEWAAGWEATKIFSRTGFAEPDAIFATRDDEGRESLWVVTRHEPSAWRVDFLVHEAPRLAISIAIALHAVGTDRSTAEISYTYTGLSEEGNRYVNEAAGARFENMVREWEEELNRFVQDLRAGRQTSFGGAV